VALSSNSGESLPDPPRVDPASSASVRPLLLVGRIGRVHGMRGQVSVTPLGNDPGRMAPGRELWFQKTGEPSRLLRVASNTPHAKRFLVRFDGVDSREDAERLAGGDLLIAFDPDDLAPGQYYPHQLEGLEVFTVGGDAVGRVVGVVFGPGREFLEVQAAGGKTVLVPFHGDIVKEVDLTGRCVKIDPPAGLLDL
jgi:16S rRNA processing protein RimM